MSSFSNMVNYGNGIDFITLLSHQNRSLFRFRQVIVYSVRFSQGFSLINCKSLTCAAGDRKRAARQWLLNGVKVRV